MIVVLFAQTQLYISYISPIPQPITRREESSHHATGHGNNPPKIEQGPSCAAEHKDHSYVQPQTAVEGMRDKSIIYL